MSKILDKYLAIAKEKKACQPPIKELEECKSLKAAIALIQGNPLWINWLLRESIITPAVCYKYKLAGKAVDGQNIDSGMWIVEGGVTVNQTGGNCWNYGVVKQSGGDCWNLSGGVVNQSGGDCKNHEGGVLNRITEAK